MHTDDSPSGVVTVHLVVPLPNGSMTPHVNDIVTSPGHFSFGTDKKG